MENIRPKYRVGQIERRGWVYALSNTGRPGVLKIGSARHWAPDRIIDPDAMLKDDRPWRISLRVDAADCSRLERALLARMSRALLRQRKEMVEATAGDVIGALETLVGPLRPTERFEYAADWSRVAADAKEAGFALKLPGLEEWMERNYSAIIRGWPTPEATASRMYAEAFPGQPPMTPQGLKVALLRVGKRARKQSRGTARAI